MEPRLEKSYVYDRNMYTGWPGYCSAPGLQHASLHYWAKCDNAELYDEFIKL